MKGKKAKRYLAFLMSAAMLLQQNGIVTLAEETLPVETVTPTPEVSEAYYEEEAPAEETAPVEVSTPVEEAAPIEEAAPVEESAPIEEPASVEEPASEEAVEPAEEDTEPAETPADGDAEPTEAPAEEDAEPTEVPAEEDAEPTEVPAEEDAEPTEAPDEEADPTETPAPEATPTEVPEVTVTPEPTPTEVPEEAAILTGAVEQKVLQETEGDRTVAVVKYKLAILNSAETKESEHTTIKTVLPSTLSYRANSEETEGILVDGRTITWTEQSIAAGSTAEYVFYATVADQIIEPGQLKADFYIDEQLLATANATWIDTDLLVIPEPEEGPVSVSTINSGITITVSALNGTLKPGTEVLARRVSNAAAVSTVEDVIDTDENYVEHAIAFDITLRVDGEEIQPDDTVQVTFSGIAFAEEAAADDDKELIVVHADSVGAEATDLEAEVAGDVVAVEADHFSVYAVAVLDKLNKVPEENYHVITEPYSAQNSFTYSDGQNTYSSIAFDFHLFANSVEFNNHTNGNVAANTFDGHGNAFGTNQNKNEKISEYNYIGDKAENVGQIASGTTVIGSGITATASDNGNKLQFGGQTDQEHAVAVGVYQESTTSDRYINIQQELDNLSNMSAVMAEYGASHTTSTEQSQDGVTTTTHTQAGSNNTVSVVKPTNPSSGEAKLNIEVSGTPGSVVYLNISAADVAISGKTLLNIYGTEDVTLIINVDMTGVTDPTLLNNVNSTIYTYGTAETNKEDNTGHACSVLWNFYQTTPPVTVTPTPAESETPTPSPTTEPENPGTSSGYYTYSNTSSTTLIGVGADHFMGTLLAPGANLQYGALNGSAIANKLTSGGKESHNWRFTGLSANITLYKSLVDPTDSSAKTFYFALYKDGQRVAGQRVQSVSLSSGETKSVQFTNLTAGETYQVYETDSTGNPVSDNGYVITGNGQSITLASSGAEATIMNTKEEPTTMSYKVNKLWQNESGSGLPASEIKDYQVTVNLVNGTGAVVRTETLSASNNWTYTWKDLAIADGPYSVQEVQVPGFKTDIIATSNNGSTIINTKADTTEYTVTKKWQDSNGQALANPPASIEVTLYSNGEKYDTQTLSPGNNWTYTWKNLPKEGKTYSAKETAVEGYEALDPVTKDSSTTFTNRKIEKTEISVTKKWEDNENQDGIRPASIKVQLYANGAAFGDPITLKENNKWSHSWKNLDKKANGSEITYAVDEIELPSGYGKEITKKVTETGTEFTITNTHETEKTEVSVKKVWSDDNNRDKVRPGSIKVQLYAGTEKAGGEVELNESNSWSYTWKNLNKNADGVAIVYTVDETEVPAGYTREVTNDGTAFTITNTHENEKTAIQAEKEWDDSENQDGKRPSSITVQLYKDGAAEGAAVTLDDSNGWKTEWTDLTKNRADGTAYEYTVDEISELPEGYTKDVTPEGTKFIITNSYGVERTGVSVKKVWADDNNRDRVRPASITVQLYADGVEVDGKTAVLNEANGWAASFTKLDKYKDGAEIVYTVDEISELPEGYEKKVTQDRTAFTITNSRETEKTEVSVKKEWEDDNNRDKVRPESIKVQLYAGTEKAGEEVELNESNSWSYTWKNLDKNADGTAIEYKVDETEVPAGYSKEVTNEGTAFTITNTHENEKTAIQAEKEWDDSENQDGKRPSSITVQLYKDGAAEGAEVTLDESNEWKTEWTDLTKNRADGTPYEYTVDETSELPEGYTKDVTPEGTKFIITNSYGVEKTGVSVKKVWADGNNRNNTRPARITVQLYADEVAVEEKTVVLNEDNQWSGSFTGLDKYKDGVEIIYTVDETEIPAGYEKNVTNDGTEFIITNTDLRVRVSKVDVADGTELDGAHIQIIDSEGNVVDEWDSEAGNAHVTEGLKTGETYTLRETVAPTGYTITADSTFSIDENGEITASGTVTSDGTILVEDSKTEVRVSKVDVADGTELDGAHIQIIDSEGNVVDEWDSEAGNAHVTEGLKTGETYTLRETVAPTGYTITADSTFSIDENGEITASGTVTSDGTILVEDSKTEVRVSKVDVADGTELDGAHIQIIDSEGNVVDEWDSEAGNAHVTEGLKTGETYTLRETVAPEGYHVTVDATFSIDENGNITSTGTIREDGVLLVEDTAIGPMIGSIAVTKKLVSIDDEEFKFRDRTFYVGLFEDETCTTLVEGTSILPLEFKDASSATVTFENLEIGRTYYVQEVTEGGEPAPVGVVEGTAYVAQFEVDQTVELTEDENQLVINFANQFVEIPDGAYHDGSIEITKELLGVDGSAKGSDKIFYAGIFADAAFTTLAENVSQNLVALELNGESSATVLVGTRLYAGDVLQFYVTETDENGVPVETSADFSYILTVEGEEVTLEYGEIEEATVIITNQEVEETPTPTPEITPTVTPTVPKTGDDTPIAYFIYLMIAAGAVLVLVFALRRKSNKKNN